MLGEQRDRALSEVQRRLLSQTLLIKVTRPVEPPSDDALYEAARGWWRIAARRRGGDPSAPRYVAVVRNNLIVAAYLIEGWEGPNAEGRWRFQGRSDLTLDGILLGVDVGAHYPRGAQNRSATSGRNWGRRV